jgi:SAM-dependent methyltransferase
MKKSVGFRLLGLLAPKIGRSFGPKQPSLSRQESNHWLKGVCQGITGDVISIGSGDDRDGEGATYRDYFPSASSYTTSEVVEGFPVDMVVDIRSMPEILDGSYDCVFCSGVLEHVDDFRTGLDEMTRILKPGGILLLGLPFRQGLHMQPFDFWRFTEYGIRHMLERSYSINDLLAIDAADPLNPAAYWTFAVKKA